MSWVNEEFKFMSGETFVAIVEEAAVWPKKFRMEFAERGEPSFHPHLPEFIEFARKRLSKVQIMLTTNGSNIKTLGKEAYRNWVIDLLENRGLNIIMIDAYATMRYETLKELFPEGKLFYEEGVHPYRYNSPKFKQIILVGKHHGEKDIIRMFQNMGGSVDTEKAASLGYDVLNLPDEQSLKKSCVRPFREIVFHYDGTVPLCCNDWKEETVIGKAGQPIEEIWGNYDEYRKLLMKKDRSKLKPCDKCSERAGFRVGLENWTWKE